MRPGPMLARRILRSRSFSFPACNCSLSLAAFA